MAAPGVRGGGGHVRGPVEPLKEWLDATYRIVAAEVEMDGLNWDGFLMNLLDGPGTSSG